MVGGGLYSTLGNCMFSCFHIMVHTRIQISAGDGVVVRRIGLSEIVRLGIGTGITRKAIKKKKSPTSWSFYVHVSKRLDTKIVGQTKRTIINAIHP